MSITNPFIVCALGANILRNTVEQRIEMSKADLSGESKVGDFQVVTAWMGD